jgi:hypothetical protein
MLKGISNYKQTYQYQELLKEHNLSEYGIWEVRGEDPNCDLGGHHSQPFLGHFEGTLEDVLNIAVDLPNFWQWGAGDGHRDPRRLRRRRHQADDG